MIIPINLRYGDRKVDFCLDLDANVPTDYAVLHYARQSQPCEPECVYVMLRALKEGDTAVDCGANIGFFTVLMSKLVGETGQVVAFEPGHNNLARLRTNLALNKCKNVRVVEKPLWSSVKHDLKLYHYADGGANTLFSFKSDDISVSMKSTTLDDEVSNPRLIKLDIEGAEVRALRGGWKVRHGNPIILTEINEGALERAGSTIEELRDVLNGTDAFALSDTGNYPVYIPRSIQIKPVKPNSNMMFCSLGQVQELWSEAFV